jgi:hypothetical protein
LGKVNGSILRRMGLAFALLASAVISQAPTPTVWDTMPDTWSATDGLGRVLPNFDAVGAPRKDRYVGVFFFLWHGAHVSGGPYDNSLILARHPDALHSSDSPPWGPMLTNHHWGQSVFGYYLSDDDYVLRRQAQMLSDAGVDVIIFDVTNQFLYKPYYTELMNVFSQIRQEGGKTPQIAFLTAFGSPSQEVATLYHELYKPKIHPELWFYWKGKPLILADTGALGTQPDPQAKTFFTFRKPQPDYFQGPTGPDQWSWLEVFPQHVFKDAAGKTEQMSVGVAQNAVGGKLGSMSQPGAQGRNWHDGANDATPGAVNWGLNFREQSSRALAEDPEFVFVTGWNEWFATRFPEFAGYKAPSVFVDEFNEEFSRDIEPMVGGHGDDYYYQLVDFVRRYKGVRPLPSAGPAKKIRVGGDFRQWTNVGPEYRDDDDDSAHRDHPGWNGLHYLNKTGRNDFVAMKVSRDDLNLYFYVRTKGPITPPHGNSWMNLLIKVGPATEPNWESYRFIVNRRVVNSRTSTLERSLGAWNWQGVCTVSYRVAGNEMQWAIPRAALGLKDKSRPVRLEFKWTDNLTHPGSVADFITDGDVAPNGRFTYRYETN